MTAVTDAWQAALRAEQQAAFGYALLGPRLPSAQQALARTCQAATRRSAIAPRKRSQQPARHPRLPAGDYPALYPKAGTPAGARRAVGG